MTVRVLPGVKQPPQAPPPPEHSFSFQFYRRERGWCVWHHEGDGRRNLSCYGIPLAPTKAIARQRARAYAIEHDIAYAEWVKPPPPTDAEAIQLSRASAYGMILFRDKRAEDHEKAEHWREAAESWTGAARACEEAISMSPGAARHFAECAASRVGRAERALAIWRRRLMSTTPTDGLRVLRSQGDGDGR